MSENTKSSKLDLKITLKHLYTAPVGKVVSIEVPPMNFLTLDGKGDPNTAQEYQDAIEALYSVAYSAKFLLKKAASIDYAIMQLEGLWWVDDEEENKRGNQVAKEHWRWTMMLMQPECVTKEWFTEACQQAQRKKDLPALPKLHLERFHEGRAAQIMHPGPFATEGPTLEKLDNFLEEQGYTFRGKHHEIYLNDLRRTVPEKLRTLIRHPFQ